MPRTSLYSKAKYSCEEKKHLLISTKGDKTSGSKRQDKKGAAGAGLVPLEESRRFQCRWEKKHQQRDCDSLTWWKDGSQSLPKLGVHQTNKINHAFFASSGWPSFKFSCFYVGWILQGDSRSPCIDSKKYHNVPQQTKKFLVLFVVFLEYNDRFFQFMWRAYHHITCLPVCSRFQLCLTSRVFFLYLSFFIFVLFFYIYLVFLLYLSCFLDALASLDCKLSR